MDDINAEEVANYLAEVRSDAISVGLWGCHIVYNTSVSCSEVQDGEGMSSGSEVETGESTKRYLQGTYFNSEIEGGKSTGGESTAGTSQVDAQNEGQAYGPQLHDCDAIKHSEVGAGESTAGTSQVDAQNEGQVYGPQLLGYETANANVGNEDRVYGPQLPVVCEDCKSYHRKKAFLRGCTAILMQVWQGQKNYMLYGTYSMQYLLEEMTTQDVYVFGKKLWGLSYFSMADELDVRVQMVKCLRDQGQLHCDDAQWISGLQEGTVERVFAKSFRWKLLKACNIVEEEDLESGDVPIFLSNLAKQLTRAVLKQPDTFSAIAFQLLSLHLSGAPLESISSVSFSKECFQRYWKGVLASSFSDCFAKKATYSAPSKTCPMLIVPTLEDRDLRRSLVREIAESAHPLAEEIESSYEEVGGIEQVNLTMDFLRASNAFYCSHKHSIVVALGMRIKKVLAAFFGADTIDGRYYPFEPAKIVQPPLAAANYVTDFLLEFVEFALCESSVCEESEKIQKMREAERLMILIVAEIILASAE